MLRPASWRADPSAWTLCRLADARLCELLQAFRETSQAHRQRMQEEQKVKALEDELLFGDY